MKSRGFTVIELMASFSIAIVILYILFNITIMLKDNLNQINSKTNILLKKDNLSYNINKRFKEKEISSITNCEDGNVCYLFTYSDSSFDKLIYDNTNKFISFNNYVLDITDDIDIESPTLEEHYDTMNSSLYNGYFILNIPISIDNTDYSINILKFFNTDNMMINLDNV